MKIAISGKSGCGNSTVSRLVAEKLGLRLINYTFHSIAKETGTDFRELQRQAEQSDYWDRYLDKRQVEMASEGNCVLGSRLAIWLLYDADLKVYLEAPIEVRAKRIQKREGGDFHKILQETEERDKKDHQRYVKIYNLDNNQYHFADLIIETEDHTPDEIANIIAAKIAQLKKNK